RVETQGLDRIPVKGPIIVIVNHVNYLELPILYSRVPTDVGTGYSKAENWDSPLLRFVFNNWDLIPLERGEADVTAMRRGFEALVEDKILFITPEGTRSHHGRLQKAKPGVVLMAIRSGVPVWPIACYGGERYTENIKHGRRTDYHVVVGDPFTVDRNGTRITAPVRQKIVDEMMYQIAALMPPAYRGYYQDVSTATEEHLRFAAPDHSNLSRVTSGKRWAGAKAQPSLP
ncbi:MAG: 1-acyl-sn-glycerol-3-phosphate acyltransferase, partial [Anaerolineae bacterium]|nr:1-acyl-sn-glycerol-3-phosphate acyltransferase [Anaerolineae bacterium]